MRPRGALEVKGLRDLDAKGAREQQRGLRALRAIDGDLTLPFRPLMAMEILVAANLGAAACGMMWGDVDNMWVVHSVNNEYVCRVKNQALVQLRVLKWYWYPLGGIDV